MADSSSILPALATAYSNLSRSVQAATVEREKHKSEILEKTFRQALEKAQQEPNTKPRGIFDDE